MHHLRFKSEVEKTIKNQMKEKKNEMFLKKFKSGKKTARFIANTSICSEIVWKRTEDEAKKTN